MKIKINVAITGLLLLAPNMLWARDVEYKAGNGEIEIRLNPGEPTQISFEDPIAGGYKKKGSAVSLDRKGNDLILFANEALTSSEGEAIIVKLQNGSSYSVRAKRSDNDHVRDDFVNIIDNRVAPILTEDEEDPAYKEKKFDYAPSTQVSGLMRELVLASEFGKAQVPGYRRSDKYKGQMVLNDGTVLATIDTIWLGPSLWGYVLDVKNVLDQTQKLNPASFRLDGTRAISAKNWELAAKPLTLEEKVSGKDSTKLYVITRAKATR